MFAITFHGNEKLELVRHISRINCRFALNDFADSVESVTHAFALVSHFSRLHSG